MSENKTQFSSTNGGQRGRSLQRLLLYSFLLLTIGLSVVVTVNSAVTGFREMRQAAVDRLELTANLKQQQIERWLDDRGTDLAVLAIDPSFVERLEALEDAVAGKTAYSALSAQLVAFLGHKSAFVELFVMDADSGITLVSTDPLREGEKHGSMLYFEEGKERTFYRAVSPSPGIDPEMTTPTLLITHPVYDPNTGQPQAVLAGRANLADLAGVINEMGGLEETGETYMVGAAHQIVVTSGEMQGRAVRSEGIDAAQSGEEGWGTYQNYAGTSVVGVYRWIPRMGLALLVEQEQSAVMQAARNQVLRNIAVAVVALLGATALAIALSRAIVRPLTYLTQEASAIAEGDLDRQIQIDRRDEIGVLADAFARMTARLRELIGSLEQRVAERTETLASRTVQLETAAQVSEAAGSVLELDQLVREVVELIQERFGYYYVGLFLVDQAGERTGEPNRWAVLGAGTGEAGEAMLEAGHKLEVGGDSMIGWCVANGQARIALDVGQEAVRFDNPWLPETRSEMALPLAARGRVIGALTVQSERASAFSDEDISVLQTMAASVANAIQNARLFEGVQRSRIEQQRRSEELGALHNVALELAQEQRDVGAVLEIAARRVMSLLDADGGGVWLWREQDGELELVVTFQVGEVDFAGRRLKPGEGLTGRAFAEKRIQVVDDYIAWAGRASTFDDAPFHAAMALPLTWQDQVIGVLVATRSQRGYAFSIHEQHLAELLANQTTAFIQNARLFEQIQRRSLQLQTSVEVSRAASSIRDVEKLLVASVDLIRERFDLYYAGLFLLDKAGESAVLRAGAGEVGKQMMAQGYKLPVDDDSMIGRCVGRGEVCIELNVDQNRMHLADSHRPETRFEIALPLSARGQVIGAMTIQCDKEAAFSEADVSALQIMADQLANAIENSRLFEVEQRRRRRATALQQATMALSSVRELDQVYEETLDQLARAIPYDSASLFVYDPEARVARAVAARGVSSEAMDEIVHGTAFHVAIDESPLFQEIVEEEQPIILEDAQADERFLSLKGTDYIRGWMGLPMLVRDQVIGILAVDSRERGAFDRDTTDQAVTFAAQAGLAMENARLFQETQASLREITRLHQRYLQEQWDEFLGQEDARQRAAYLYDQRQVQPLDDLWRPEIEAAVARGRTLALSAEDGVWEGSGDEAKSALVVPLRLRDQIIGALDFFETDLDRQWSEEEVALVEEVADQVALAVENARAYEEIQRTAEKLREMDTLKSQFLANMSHELRTPLNSIIGFSRVILKGIDGPLTDLQRQDLTSIYNNGQHLLGLINDVLDMSRIEAGKMELVFEPMELSPIIDGVMSTAIGLVKDKPVKLVKDVADDLPIIRADSTRIRQVMLNLVSNAAKFTNEGSITLSVWMEDGHVVISVSDTGIGVPEEQQEKIFQEFEQVDGSATRSTGGTGLGLPISRHFVELHGGEIWVESGEGKGTTFAFTIPIHGPDAVSDPELAALEIDPDRRLILTIEDNADTVEFYRRYLADHNYQVVGLADGTKAQHWVRELAPFAVLLDIVLPDVDGWEVLEGLKTSRETAHVPVIICSVVDKEAKGLSMGAAAFLHKPILKDDLVQAMALAAKLQSQ